MTTDVENFLNDIDKVYDLLDSDVSKKEFLKTYSYITAEEYNKSISDLYADLVSNMAYYLRDAENMLIEENTYFDNEETNPYKGFSVSGEQFKTRVWQFMDENMTTKEIEEVREIADGMGC